jgi:hypothetical protein
MSDELEQVFSRAHCTVLWERVQMDAKTLEKVECLKHWKQSSISNDGLKVLSRE